MTDRLNTSVKIGQVQVYWLNRAALKDVIIKDRNGNLALEADNITVGFQLLPALQKKWRLTTIRLFGVACHISRETPQADANLQFMIDAFAKKEDGEAAAAPAVEQEGSIELQVQSILVRRSSIFYDVASAKRAGDRFDPNHIAVHNINGNFSIGHISADSLNVRIKRLSFNEASGLSVDRTAVNIAGNRDSIIADNLELSMPLGSRLHISSAGIQWSDVDSLPLFLRQAPLYLNIEKSRIAFGDFAALVPALKNSPDAIDLSARISGYVNSISFDDIMMTWGKDVFFSGDMDIKGLADSREETYLFGRVKQANITLEGVTKASNYFNGQKLVIPQPVMNIREVAFNGEISGFVDHLVAYGNLSSSIGSVQMDLLISNRRNQTLFKGNVASSDIRLNALFEPGNLLGTARFNAKIDLLQSHGNGESGKLDSGRVSAQIQTLGYKGYNYENINISGRFKNGEYEGNLLVDDPNGRIELEGAFRQGEKVGLDLTASVSNLRPDRLHLIDKYKDPNISFEIKAGVTGSTKDDIDGYVTVQNLSFRTAQDSFVVQNLHVDTQIDEQPYRRITLSSDFVNGELKGVYSFSSLASDMAGMVDQYLPALVGDYTKADPQQPIKDNIFNYYLTVENTDHLSKTLRLPLAILDKTYMYGNFNNVSHTFYTKIETPRFRVGNTLFEKGNLQLGADNAAASLSFNVSQNDNNIHNTINLEACAKDNGIQTKLYWENDHENRFETEITAAALFVEDSDSETVKKLRTEITIPSARIILKDSLWQLEPASITIANGDINIDNFYLTRSDQYIHINGVISNNPRETLLVDLKDIETGYIFDILNIPSVHFGGRATGTVNARDLPGSMMIDGRLEIADFAFNHAIQGKLNLSSEWDNDHQGILLLGTIYKNDTTWTDVNGYIFPVGDSQGLSLYFEANELNIAFMEKYLDAFASEVSGQGFGKVHLHGNFSDVFIEGAVYVKDARMKMNILNAAYSFSDSIYLNKQSVEIRETALRDRNGNTGWLDMNVMHDCFRNIRYDVNVKADKVLVYDIPERTNPQMYGQIHASGAAQISGTEDFILVNGNLRSEAGTAIHFNFMDNSTVENYDFITFVDTLRRTSENRPSLTATIPPRPDENNTNGTDYQLNFNINITPEAHIEWVMDPVAGDKIRGAGSGDIQLQYGSRNDLQMFGNYLITEGAYNFSLQQVIRKRFDIRNGSVISFRGDPMDANLDINAVYSLTTNIQDLDETFLLETGTPNIPVNCILKLNGRIQNPTIAFDIELPNSSMELERRVRSFIDTEDMMNRQIIYLLAIGTFYTPDYSRNDYRSGDIGHLASSALSSQLSGILNNLTDKVRIGANIHTRQDGVKDTQVGMLLYSQLLNNRLIFNGNFGYKDNYIQTNAFVGEFDLEYKLTRNGGIGLKAYNHANDLYRYNSRSLTRQGVGLMFRKDFSVLSEVFSGRKRKKTEGGAPSEP